MRTKVGCVGVGQASTWRILPPTPWYQTYWSLSTQTLSTTLMSRTGETQRWNALHWKTKVENYDGVVMLYHFQFQIWEEVQEHLHTLPAPDRGRNDREANPSGRALWEHGPPNSGGLQQTRPSVEHRANFRHPSPLRCQIQAESVGKLPFRHEQVWTLLKLSSLCFFIEAKIKNGSSGRTHISLVHSYV